MLLHSFREFCNVSMLSIVAMVALPALLVALLVAVLLGSRLQRRLAIERRTIASQVDARRARERELTTHLREEFERIAGRADRALRALARLKAEASAPELASIDAVNVDVAENRRAAAEGLSRVDALEREPLAPWNTEASTEATATLDALTRRQERAEGRMGVLQTRAAVAAAERFADEGQLTQAEEQLHEASVLLSGARRRLGAELKEDPDSRAILDALTNTIASVRVGAAEHRQPMDRAIAASDSLFEALETREERYT